MKAQVSPVQSIEPRRIFSLTWDLNQGPPGPQSRVVITILPLHTILLPLLVFLLLGLLSHPQHELAKRQMRGYSGMITFYIKGGEPEARNSSAVSRLAIECFVPLILSTKSIF